MSQVSYTDVYIVNPVVRSIAGRHTITVRATDGDGALQTPDRAAPIPDGASGWHSIVVLVT